MTGIVWRVWKPALLAFALLLSSPLHNALAQEGGETVTLAEYRARLEQIILDLSQSAASGGGAAEGALQAAREALRQVAAVQLPSGEVIKLQPALSEEHTLDQALNRLRLIQSQLAASESDNTAARLEQLKRILARPEFGPTLWERIVNWLRDLLRRLWPDQVSPEAGAAAETASNVLQWVIASVGGVLIALLLSYWLHGFLRSFVADAEARRRLEAGEDAPLTATEARQQAARLAQLGNYRQAVRQLYLSALLQLEDSGFLNKDRSLTNREYVAQVAHIPPIYIRFRPVVETFDAVWYGIREPDHEAFHRYEQAIDSLNQAIPTVEPPAPPSSGDQP